MASRERVAPKAAAEKGPAARGRDQIADFRAGLIIDKHAIDDELVRGPQKFNDVCDAVAMAISRRDAAKDELKVTEAEVDKVVRAVYADDETKKKPTETQVANEVLLHRDVREARKTLLDCQEEVERLTAMKESYMQRSYAIKDLVSLHLASYFGQTEGSIRSGIRNEINQKGGDARHLETRRSQNEHRLRDR
jgi:hypothetical protein